MLRKSVWMAVALVVLSMLTACPHKELMGSGGPFAPKDEKEERPRTLESQDGFLGRWEAREPITGPVTILEFRADGTAASSVMARITTRYSIVGDKVFLAMVNTQGQGQPSMPADNKRPKAVSPESEPIVYTFTIERDKLIMTNDATGEVLDMRRADQATTEDPIVGLWSYVNSNGETASMRFDADGINISSVPIPGVLESEYEVRGDVITVRSLDGRQAQSVHYRLEDRLFVVIDGEKTTHYDRQITAASIGE